MACEGTVRATAFAGMAPRLSGLSAHGGLARMEYEQGEVPLFIPPWCATAFAGMARSYALILNWSG